jgi:hypothetical protein
MTDIYCGIGKVPKGQKLGTMKECAEKKQIRYYGLKKVDSRIINSAKNEKEIPETLQKIRSMVIKYRVRIKKLRISLEGKEANDPKKKKEMMTALTSYEKELDKVLAKLRKKEIEADKAKETIKKETIKKETIKKETIKKETIKKGTIKKGTNKETIKKGTNKETIKKGTNKETIKGTNKETIKKGTNKGTK